MRRSEYVTSDVCGELVAFDLPHVRSTVLILSSWRDVLFMKVSVFGRSLCMFFDVSYDVFERSLDIDLFFPFDDVSLRRASLLSSGLSAAPLSSAPTSAAACLHPSFV